jgi:hypothetical protein
VTGIACGVKRRGKEKQKSNGNEKHWGGELSSNKALSSTYTDSIHYSTPDEASTAQIEFPKNSPLYLSPRSQRV